VRETDREKVGLVCQESLLGRAPPLPRENETIHRFTRQIANPNFKLEKFRHYSVGFIFVNRQFSCQKEYTYVEKKSKGMVSIKIKLKNVWLLERGPLQFVPRFSTSQNKEASLARSQSASSTPSQEVIH
jgi:hypothetical protein